MKSICSIRSSDEPVPEEVSPKSESSSWTTARDPSSETSRDPSRSTTFWLCWSLSERLGKLFPLHYLLPNWCINDVLFNAIVVFVKNIPSSFNLIFNSREHPSSRMYNGSDLLENSPGCRTLRGFVVGVGKIGVD